MNRRQALRLVRAVSGEDDAEFVDVLPPVARYDDQVLSPSRMIRIGQRFLVEMREVPGEWWMGEMHDGQLFVWGSYGSLDEAAAAH